MAGIKDGGPNALVWSGLNEVWRDDLTGIKSPRHFMTPPAEISGGINQVLDVRFQKVTSGDFRDGTSVALAA